MANLRDCIEAAIATGKLTREQGEELFRRLDGQRDAIELTGEVSPEAALSEAEKAALAQARIEVAEIRRQTVLQAIALRRATDQVNKHSAGVRTGVMSLLVKDVGGRAGFSNIDNRASAILAAYHAKFADGLNRFRTKYAGLTQDKEGLRNMVRELFGTDSGDAGAKAIADLWGEVAEMARLRFNKAGGRIPKREDWGMPQWHDGARVAKIPRNEWIDYVKPMLDLERMVDEAGNPLNASQIDELLSRAYDNITTEGLASLVPGRMGGAKLANRHREHRVLPFKDGDTWLEYHDRFGHADIYATLTDHLSRMATETAQLEILGPNPELAWRTLRDMALREDGSEGVQMAMLDAVWNVTSGKANRISSTTMADFMTAVRNILVSTRLGGAFLSALSDTAFLRQTSAYNGIPASKVFARMTSLMNPSNAEDRLLAVKMQLTADAWTHVALAANRFTDVTGAGFSAKVADFTMRASLLSAWTDAGRKAFGMEFDAFIADNTARAFGELPEALRNAFGRYGITPAEWEILRATPLLEHKGARFFSAENLMARTDIDESRRVQLATKLQEMIITEMDYAVPMPDARVRAITTGGIERGTFLGEIARSVAQFKSFPITVIATHLYRGALENQVSDKAKYLAAITISTTVMGLVAMQAKEISRGKDPRDVTDPKTWAAAFLQGGGAGIYGDFVMADANRFGGGPLDTSMGPVYSFAEDTLKLTLGNVQQAVKGEDMELGADLVNFARGYTPGGSLWYSRLAYERLVLDQLQKMADPGASRRFRRIQRRRAREYNQDYFWRPGETAPDRAPQFGD